MKIINLTNKDKVYFSGLDPLEMLEEAQDKEEFCLGASNDTEEGDVPTGLIICSQRGSEVIIRWLYVEPKERGKGYGEALLSRVWEAAEQAGCRYLCAYVPRRYGWDYLCPSGDNFLKNQGFDTCFASSDESGKLYVLDMEGEEDSLPMSDEFSGAFVAEMPSETSDRMKALLVRLDREEPSRTAEAAVLYDEELTSKERVSLSELTLPQLGRCIEKYLSDNPQSGPKDGAFDFPPTWFDLEKSTCIIADGEAMDVKIKK